jgi:multicomponent K+:H+ antiporter subunit E
MKKLPLFLIVTLVFMWVLLNGTISLAVVLFGLLLATLLARSIAHLRPVRPRLRNLHVAIPLIGTWLADILQSNLSVARIVLGLERRHEVHSGFLDIPLELKDPHGLALLSVIVTSTPGTTWAGVAADGKVLRLHILDLHNSDQWIDFFKQKYERRLIRIFE